MKVLENTFTQSDNKVLVDSEQAKIELTTLAEDLSIATITVHGLQEYSFKARSGLLTPQVGSGTISNGKETHEVTIFNRVAVQRGEQITIKNGQQIPFVLNFISAN